MILLNGKKVYINYYPNGEMYIDTNKLNLGEKNVLEVKYEDDRDIINMIFLAKHIDSNKLDKMLIIPYFPYSRMDRTEGIRLFTLKYLCEIINKLNFYKVIIFEPHSDVVCALLDRLVVMDSTMMLTNKAIKELQFNSNKEDYIFYPDSGAIKRYSKQIKYNKILVGNKEREFSTGRIKKLSITGEIPKSPFRVIIVDDLCSKGGTFILSAKKLKELGAKEIYLVVTHCENTIFGGEILSTDLINKVYTTNSILSKEHKKINIQNIFSGGNNND